MCSQVIDLDFGCKWGQSHVMRTRLLDGTWQAATDLLVQTAQQLQQANNNDEKMSNNSYTNKWRCNTYASKSTCSAARQQLLLLMASCCLKTISKCDFEKECQETMPELWPCATKIAALPQIVTILNVARSSHSQCRWGSAESWANLGLLGAKRDSAAIWLCFGYWTLLRPAKMQLPIAVTTTYLNDKYRFRDPGHFHCCRSCCCSHCNSDIKFPPTFLLGTSVCVSVVVDAIVSVPQKSYACKDNWYLVMVMQMLMVCLSFYDTLLQLLTTRNITHTPRRLEQPNRVSLSAGSIHSGTCEREFISQCNKRHIHCTAATQSG